MDFTWADEQLAMKQGAVEFARKELDGGLTAADEASEFRRDHWRKCAAFGILGSPVPEDYGGLGNDILTTMLIMEGLGYGCRDNGLIFSLNAQTWSVQHPILAFGTEEQKRKYLPDLCSGEVVAAHGMTEPGAGSDAFGSLRTTAERRGDEYVLNGTKTLVTNAPVADLAFDRVRGGEGLTGLYRSDAVFWHLGHPAPGHFPMLGL